MISSEGSTGEESASKVTTHCLLDRGLQFLAGYELEAALGSLSHGPLLHDCLSLQNVQTQRQQRISASNVEVTIFYNLIMEMMSHHLFHRINSLGLAHTQGEGIMQGHEY